MIVQPAQLAGRQSRHSTLAMLMFNFRTQYCDSFCDILLYLLVNAAEQCGRGCIENCRKRESSTQRWEPVTVFISRHFRAFLRSQQKGHVLLCETGSSAICSNIVVEP